MVAEFANETVVVLVVTLELTVETVPSPVATKPLPSLIPPNASAVAVVNSYGVPVLTEIVPSPLILTPDPILTPPNASAVAVVNS